MNPVYRSLRGAVLSGLFVFLALVLVTAPACAMQDPDQGAEEGAAAAGEEASDEEENTLYALGLAMAQGLAQFDLTEEELETVREGLTDGVMGNEPRVDPQEYMPRIQQLAQERAQAASEAERQAGSEYLEEAAGAEGATKTESGMVFQSLEEGSGESPEASDRVQVHYRGTLRDGEVFDSSYERGQPATFGLAQVIPCWTEGLQLMKVGGKAQLVCPPDLAYGDRPAGSTPPGSTLTFEVELLDVVEEPAAEEPAPPPAAEDGQEEGEGEG